MPKHAAFVIAPLILGGALALTAATDAGADEDDPEATAVAEDLAEGGQITVPGAVGAGSGASYAKLSRASCEAELSRRKVQFRHVDTARGVLAPVRLTGPIAGVTFHSGLPSSQRATSPYEIFDCRLVLALTDFAKILAAHDVVDVTHFSAYRPPAPKSLPQSGQGKRHGGGLALDTGVFTKKDGSRLVVEKDFKGAIRTRACLPDGSTPKNGTELRAIACETASARLFNVLLTPNYNWQHRNHFHLEVTAGVSWYLVR